MHAERSGPFTAVLCRTKVYGRHPFDPREPDYLRKFHVAEYKLPGDVPASASVKDLLSRLLVADPKTRMRLPEILQHPWFLDALPAGALQMNDHYLEKAPRISPEVGIFPNSCVPSFCLLTPQLVLPKMMIVAAVAGCR